MCYICYNKKKEIEMEWVDIFMSFNDQLWKNYLIDVLNNTYLIVLKYV